MRVIIGCLRFFRFGLVFDLAVWGCHEELFEGVLIVEWLLGHPRILNFLHFLFMLILGFEEFLLLQICLTSHQGRRRLYLRRDRFDLCRLRGGDSRPESALLLLFFVLDLVRVLIHPPMLGHVLVHRPVSKAPLGLLDDFHGFWIEFGLEFQALNVLIFVRLPQLVLVLVIFLSIAVHYVSSGLRF